MITLSTLTSGVRKVVGAAYVIGVGVVDKAEETIGVHPGRGKDDKRTQGPQGTGNGRAGGGAPR